MILLDTNVVSEPLRRTPDARVTEWIDAQALETLFLSSVTVAELRAGLALLPAGKRQAGLQESLETRVLPLFSGRVLPFDPGCTQAYADLMTKARASGLAISSMPFGCTGYSHQIRRHEPPWLGPASPKGGLSGRTRWRIAVTSASRL